MTGGGGGSWNNDRLKTTYEEARVVIDHQRDVINDIDNKAMYNVRLTIVLVGIVVAAARIEGPGLFNPVLLWLGISCLVGVIVGGVYTYDESNLFLGPNSEYIDQLLDDNFQSTSWDEDLVGSFSGWVESNFDDIRWNSKLLYYTNLLLAAGVVLVVLAAAF